MRVGTNKPLHEKIWRLIGDGNYEASDTRSSRISNNSVRYVLKLHAHTIFERQERDHMKKEEMHPLATGLEPFLNTNLNNIYKLNVGALLMRHLEKVMDWAMSNRSNPIISIGGLVTPILKHFEINRRKPQEGENRIDITYLVKNHYLFSKCEGFLKYKFARAGVENCGVYLPNAVITSILNPSNIRFLVDERYLVKGNTTLPCQTSEQGQR